MAVALALAPPLALTPQSLGLCLFCSALLNCTQKLSIELRILKSAIPLLAILLTFGNERCSDGLLGNWSVVLYDVEKARTTCRCLNSDSFVGSCSPKRKLGLSCLSRSVFSR